MDSKENINQYKNAEYYVVTKIIVNKTNDSSNIIDDERIKQIKFNSDVTLYEYRYKKNTLLHSIKEKVGKMFK